MVLRLPLYVADTIRLSCLTTDSRIASKFAFIAIPTPCIAAPMELQLAVDVNRTDYPVLNRKCQNGKQKLILDLLEK